MSTCSKSICLHTVNCLYYLLARSATSMSLYKHPVYTRSPGNISNSLRTSRNTYQGFTLIEVLIALAILSIALTAIIKSTSQTIRDTGYLQNKTIATWVGTDVINKIRTGVLTLQQEPLEQKTEALGQQWLWHAALVPTPNTHIKEIHVDVFNHTGKTQLTSLTSYLYVN